MPSADGWIQSKPLIVSFFSLSSTDLAVRALRLQPSPLLSRTYLFREPRFHPCKAALLWCSSLGNSLKPAWLREREDGKRMLTYANQNPAFCQISVTPAWTEFSFYLLSGAGQLIFQATRYLIDDSSSDPQWEQGQPPWLPHKFQICLCPFWGTLADWTS